MTASQVDAVPNPVRDSNICRISEAVKGEIATKFSTTEYKDRVTNLLRGVTCTQAQSNLVNVLNEARSAETCVISQNTKALTEIVMTRLSDLKETPVKDPEATIRERIYLVIGWGIKELRPQLIKEGLVGQETFGASVGGCSGNYPSTPRYHLY